MTAETLVSWIAHGRVRAIVTRGGFSDQFVRDEFFINVIADNVGNVFDFGHHAGGWKGWKRRMRVAYLDQVDIRRFRWSG